MLTSLGMSHCERMLGDVGCHAGRVHYMSNSPRIVELKKPMFSGVHETSREPPVNDVSDEFLHGREGPVKIFLAQDALFLKML